MAIPCVSPTDGRYGWSACRRRNCRLDERGSGPGRWPMRRRPRCRGWRWENGCNWRMAGGASTGISASWRHLVDPDGEWIQAALLAAGMARVYSFRDNRTAVRTMYGLEAEARRARRGIWAHPFYRVRAPGELFRDIGSFQVVAGRVRAVATVRGTTYLNFGPDWRSDFTVMLKGRARRLFREAGLSPKALEGHRIRVRGWLRKRNGPMIEATHPEQIEPLDQRERERRAR